jgi:hypothetical protein
MARKIQKPLSKEQKRLLIALLLGDGTISSNYVFKLSHSVDQREYLEWKISLLNKLNIKNNGIKEYISTCGYNKGKGVLYSQMSLHSTIKALRRSVYIPKKTFTRNLLNWLDAQGLAIWFMDDGFININESEQRKGSVQRNIKISTCVDETTCRMIIGYFKDVWDIEFRPFIEKSKLYSISTRTNNDSDKFIKIVKPYIEQVPSLLYKIRESSTKKEFIAQHSAVSKRETLDNK